MSREPEAKAPSVVVVMGVSGAGKSTIAAMLALRLGWTYEDADWFHPPANVEKMRSGHPLTDDDRWPWLEGIAAWIDATCAAGGHGVIACSALKRAYRDVIVGGRSYVRLVYLKGERDLIARRITLRHGHFMPTSLLDGQFTTLQEPAEEEHPIVVSIDPRPHDIVEAIVAKLGTVMKEGADRGRGSAQPSGREVHQQSAVMKEISLVISDVDGTLVTPDKRLTDATVRTVRRLHERGIDFTVVSSRPPMGLRMLVEPLALKLPMGAFSGGAIVGPNLALIEEHVVPEQVARRSVDLLAAFGADVWVFTTDRWLARDPAGEYVARERQSIQAEPTLVADFGLYFAHASKIVGSTKDFAMLAKCEAALRDALGGRASVARSQPYYLDVTPPDRDKGTFVEGLSKRLAVPLEAIAVLGDMENDLAMFGKAGLSIAMGNASAEVKRQANHVTASNADDGFALAIERYILREPRSERIA